MIKCCHIIVFMLLFYDTLIIGFVRTYSYIKPYCINFNLSHIRHVDVMTTKCHV